MKPLYRDDGAARYRHEPNRILSTVVSRHCPPATMPTAAPKTTSLR